MPPATAPRLVRFAQLSVAAAVATFLLKLAAWKLTGSVGLLSDALESLANLAAALIATAALAVAGRPEDEEHAFGHSKAEYFSSGIEGLLILFAAAGIGWAAIPRVLAPQPLAAPWAGTITAVVASAVNLAVAIVLRRAGSRHGSPALTASAHHLMTDVWTSAAVVVAVILTALTGWHRIDPILGILLCFHIAFTGVKLIWSSAQGLMDASLPEAELERVKAILNRRPEVSWHALRTRQGGACRFISVHLLMPGDWSVTRAHGVADAIEHDIAEALGQAAVFTHIEPADDPASMADQHLVRTAPVRPA